MREVAITHGSAPKMAALAEIAQRIDAPVAAMAMAVPTTSRDI
jgi:hypothetical protein